MTSPKRHARTTAAGLRRIGCTWWALSARRADGEAVETARGLGSELADHGFGLSTAGRSGVETIAAEAYARRVVELDRPLEDCLVQALHMDEPDSFLAGELEFFEAEDEARHHAIQRAGAVVCIGGDDSIHGAVEHAAQLGKHVLPLADTGAAAASRYLDIARRSPSGGPPPTGRADLSVLGRPAPGVVQELMRLLSALC